MCVYKKREKGAHGYVLEELENFNGEDGAESPSDRRSKILAMSAPYSHAVNTQRSLPFPSYIPSSPSPPPVFVFSFPSFLGVI